MVGEERKRKNEEKETVYAFAVKLSVPECRKARLSPAFLKLLSNFRRTIGRGAAIVLYNTHSAN